LIKLKYLYIENFMGVTEREFSIESEGLHLIVGENGKGKSSIFEALLWAIFGKVYRGNITNKELVNENSNNGMLVKLEFDYGESEFLIIRSVDHSEWKTGLTVFENNIDITRKTMTETQKFLNNIFGEFDTFISLILFPQRLRKSFLELTDTEQKKFFDKLLNLKIYNEYLQIAKKKYEEKKTKLSEVQNEYENIEANYDGQIQSIMSEIKRYQDILQTININELKNNENMLNVRIEEINNDKSKLIESLKNENKKLSDIQSELDSYKEKIQSKIRSINNKSYNLRKKIEMRSEYLKVEKDKEIMTIKNKKLDETQKMIDEMQEKINNEKSQYEMRLSTIKENLMSIQNEINILENDIRNYQNKLQENTSYTERERDSKIQSLQKRINELQQNLSVDGICPVCLRPIDEHSKTAIENEITKLQNEISTINEQYKNILLNIYDEIQQTIIDKQNKKNEKLQLLEEYKNEIQSVEEIIKKINNDDQVEKIKQKASEEFKEIVNPITEKYNRKLQILQRRLELVEKITKEKIDSIKQNDNIINEINNRMNDQVNVIKEIENTLNAKDTELQNVINMKDDINKKIMEYETYMNNISQLKKKIDVIYENKQKELKEKENEINIIKESLQYYQFWVDAFSPNGIKNFIIGKSIPYINERLSYYLSNLTDRFMVSVTNQVQIKSGETRDRLSSIITRTTSNTVTKFEKLSGGEKRLLDIAMMFSLYDLALNYQDIVANVLFLDEVFESLDEPNVEIVVKLLKEYSSEKSVYIITHNSFWKNQDVHSIIEIS